jgi:hypothetical protein
MKKYLISLMVLGLVGLSVMPVFAGPTANQNVSFQIGAINELAVSGNPSTLIINSATAGSQPNPATDATTTYALTTNGSGKKITGQIDTNMPTGTALKVLLAAPSGASSTQQTLSSTTAVNLVTGVAKKAESGLGISYEFDATVDAGELSDSRTVTFTLTN